MKREELEAIKARVPALPAEKLSIYQQDRAKLLAYVDELESERDALRGWKTNAMRWIGAIERVPGETYLMALRRFVDWALGVTPTLARLRELWDRPEGRCHMGQLGKDICIDFEKGETAKEFAHLFDALLSPDQPAEAKP